MKKPLHLATVLFFTLLTFTVSAQETNTQSFPIKISLMDESITLPRIGAFSYEYNPAIMIGTEYILREKGNHD